MSYSDDDINRLLEGSAERWRETLPEGTEPDIAALLRGAGRRRSVAFPLGSVGALAAVVVSVAVLALIVGSLYGVFGPAGRTPGPSVTPAGQRQALYVENRGGPAFTVTIDGMAIAHVSCGAAPMLTAGQGAVPPLPWDLKISRDGDGSVLVDERVTELPKWFVQIGDSALGLSGPVAGPAGPSCPPPATPTSTQTPAPTPDGFPAAVAGMTTISVTEAERMLESGAVDGRAMAVRGFWIPTTMPSCPAPQRWMSPIEPHCGFVLLLSDTPYVGGFCTPTPEGGTLCAGNTPPPDARVTQPMLVTESAFLNQLGSVSGPDGMPVVLIMHAADPRYLQCQADVAGDCRRAGVVDRIAWANGEPVDLSVPQVSNGPTMRMTLAQVETALGSTNVITAAVTPAWQAADIDPRLRGVGNDLVWVLRSLRSGSGTDGPAQAVDVTMISDSTGEVLQSLDLAITADYQSALFSPQALEHIVDQAQTEPVVYRVDLADGTPLLVSVIQGIETNDNQVAKTLPGAPTLLEPGQYTVTAWQGLYANGRIVFGTPTNECSTSLFASAGQLIRLQVNVPLQGACTWGDPTFPDTLN